MTKLNAYLIDAQNKNVRQISIEDDLHEFYKVLNCDCIDIATREIAGKSFNIICDDEGLLKANPIISACYETGNAALVGNLLITAINQIDSPELGSLTKSDINLLESKTMMYVSNGEALPVLVLD